MRSYWQGTLSIGLLAIPVRLYGAVKTHDSKFKKVHRPCMHPIKQALKCEHCDIIANQEITRGHETGSGLFVEVTDEDLARLPLPSAGTIVLDGFKAEDILPKRTSCPR